MNSPHALSTDPRGIRRACAPSRGPRPARALLLALTFVLALDPSPVLAELITYQTKTTYPSTPSAGARYGCNVAIDDNVMVVGACQENDGKGAVYVHYMNQGAANNWGQRVRLQPEPGSTKDYFGTAVAIHNNTIAVGAPGDDEGGQEAGAVYLFEQNEDGPDNWGLVAKLVPSDVISPGIWTGVRPGDQFGRAVAIHDVMLAAGAQGHDLRAPNAGAVYVYHKLHSDTWENAAKLVPQDGAENDFFGRAVAVYGNVVAVGAPYRDSAGADAGSVYLYGRHRGGDDAWGLIKRIDAFSAGNLFGAAVALDEYLLVVGEPEAGASGHQGGSVQLFERHLGGPDNWGRVGQLGLSTAQGDEFGAAVSVHFDTVLVGIPGDDDEGGDAGAAQLFRRDAGGNNEWDLVDVIHAAGAAAGDRFGGAVCLRGNTVACGASGDDPQGENSGSVRIFNRRGNVWVLEQKIAAHDGYAGAFGTSLAMNQDTLAAGAPFRNTHGMVYLYTRNRERAGLPWQLHKYVLGSARGQQDYGTDAFGHTLAMAGDHLLVGAPGAGTSVYYAWQIVWSEEDGYAYFFHRNDGGGDNWGETARWHGSNNRRAGYAAAVTEQVAAWAPDGAGVDAPAFGQAQDPAHITISELVDSALWSPVLHPVEFSTVYNMQVDLVGDTLFLMAWQRTIDEIWDVNYWFSDADPAPDWIRIYRRGIEAVSPPPLGLTGPWGNIKQEGLLYNPPAISRPSFGRMIDADGNTLVAAVSDTIEATSADPWHLAVFERNQGGADGWGQVATIAPPEPGVDLGESLFSLSGNRLAMSAGDDRTYLFERNTGGANQWGMTTSLPVGGTPLLRGNVLVIGSPEADSDLYSDYGALYIYRLDNNHAPVLDNGGHHAVSTTEDRTGAEVVQWAASAFLLGGALVDDPDGDTCGIAVTAVSSTHGTWDFSFDGGHQWWPFHNASNANCYLLAPNERLRFSPESDFNGTIANAITFRAWDQTEGLSGATGDATENGGVTSFSAAQESFDVSVLSGNDDPVLDTSTSIYLTPIESNIPSGANSGNRVTDLIAGLWSDPDGDTCGIAVTFVNNTNGTWQFSPDGTQNWYDFVAASASEARLLAPAARVRFVPSAGFSGTVNNGVYFRAWDQTSGTSGGAANANVVSGFSDGAEQLHIVVNPAVNHAPVLDTAGEPAFSTILRNQTDNPGDMVGNLIQGRWTDADGDTCGLAVIGADTNHGDWQYRLNKGSAWTALGSVSTTSALLLNPGSKLRFLPDLNYTGTIANALRFRAWDRTTGSVGTRVSAASGGGSTAFSTATDYFAITVTATDNHAPVLDNTGTVFLTDNRPNSIYNRGDYVRDLIAGIVTDADGDECGVVAVVTYTFYGPWQYSLDDGATWHDVGAVSMSSARLLGPDAKVRFLPNAGYSGTINNGLGFRAWDQTDGESGDMMAVGAVGGDMPFSALAEYISVRTLRENHAPVLDNSAPLALTTIDENDVANPGDRVGDLISGRITDADGNVCGIAVGNIYNYYGVWEWSIDGGATWHDFRPVSGPNARLLNPDARVRYKPYMDWHGTQANGLSFRAWDQTHGVNGGTADSATNGGSTAFSAATHQAGITAREANASPTGIDLNPAAVAENQAPGTQVGTFSATDPNLGDTHTFALVSGPGDADNGAFTIAGNALRTAAVFDREAKSAYAIRVRADDGQDGLVEAFFTITVTDVSDNAPTDIYLVPPWISENQPINTPVGMLQTADLDSGDVHAYSLVPGAGDADNGLFTVAGSLLKTAVALDYEARNQCSIRVRSHDGHGGTTEKALTVAVIDLPENRAPLQAGLYPACLFGDEPAHTPVGVLSAYDPDTGDTVTCALVPGQGGDDNALFHIDDSVLRTSAPLDFAGRPGGYHVRVRFEDGAGGALEQGFTIVPAEPLFQEQVEAGAPGWTHQAVIGTDHWTITDDAPRSPTHAFFTSVPAARSDTRLNSPAIAVPPDACQLRFEFHHRIEFAGAPGSVDGGVLEVSLDGGPWADLLEPVSRMFFLDGHYGGAISGVPENPLEGRNAWLEQSGGEFWRVICAVNASSYRGHRAQFRWRLGSDTLLASPGWWIDDVRLGIVQCPQTPPTDITLAPVAVSENAPVGTVVGQLAAADVNPGNVHSFMLVSGTGSDDNAAFTIAGLELHTAQVFDYETRRAYSIRVQVQDGEGGSFSKALIVEVTDAAIEDSDGDGFTDFDELVHLHSDPHDPGSHFGIGWAKKDAGAFSIAWASVPGMTYRVQATTDLTDPDSWVDLTSDIVGQPGTTVVEVDLTAYPGYPVPAFFLRVAAMP